ncbi:uncharacterized protein B0H18DRAFT_1118697 [Fomitopsis serialis]|uniref:uncharacterized protein n=1 Tax=Fomitopsis serialis TaxID=139415 RepID=UPI002007B1AB|nr:uncharacterized protein B0H18DRAFT_1118697 [Neoantrodia serialis]KAH9926948.1 hypothetical protein B0H18DRAFT_1118697 [Neoantrodia serialis]
MHPACGQCTKAGRAIDCEYSDGKGLTASQILEEQVSQLQLRIAELESVNAAPLTLFDPYESFRRSQGGGALPSQQRCAPSSTTPLHSGFPPHPTFPSTGGFPPSTGYPNHVTLLLNAIYLAGAQFSTDAQLRAEQPTFLATVLNLLTRTLSGGADNATIMYVLQTEILLTYYFLDNNRGMESIYHWRAATSIAFACKLHLIRSSRSSSGGPASGVQYQLSAPADSLEEGERINAFWQVLILDKCLSITLSSPSAFTEDDAKGTIVDSPWPMDVSAYLSNPLPPGARGSRTIQAYMQSLGSPNRDRHYVALQSKAAILYAYAGDLAKTYSPNDYTSTTRFTYLDRGIDQLARDLPPLAGVDTSRPDILRKLLNIHLIVYCATLQLNKPIDHAGVMYQGKSWTTALNAVIVLQQVNLGAIKYMEPSAAYVLTFAAEIIVRGIMTLKSQNAIDSSNQAALLAPLSQILSAMDWWGITSPLFRQQRVLVQTMLTQI